jgi:hypothetical protein
MEYGRLRAEPRYGESNAAGAIFASVLPFE